MSMLLKAHCMHISRYRLDKQRK